MVIFLDLESCPRNARGIYTPWRWRSAFATAVPTPRQGTNSGYLGGLQILYMVGAWSREEPKPFKYHLNTI